MTGSKLQQELKKKRPFESREQEAALSVLRTADQLQICFARLFREFGLTSSQYNVLRILRGEGQPLPILEIAQRTITVVPGITGLVDRLEEAGYVRRERCANDRRVVYVTLTARAVKTLAKIDRPLAQLHERVMSKLTATELTTLSATLAKLRTALPLDDG
jgi:DNA-binding MarR family transcriptional regulator